MLRVQKPCLPTIESLVSALAGSNNFLANQTAFRPEMPSCSTPFFSPEEMAAYSAGLRTDLRHPKRAHLTHTWQRSIWSSPGASLDIMLVNGVSGSSASPGRWPRDQRLKMQAWRLRSR